MKLRIFKMDLKMVNAANAWLQTSPLRRNKLAREYPVGIYFC
jgi:hypothetical protein